MSRPLAIIGCGPSLTRQQIQYCYGKAYIMAIKQAFKWAAGAHWVHGNPPFWDFKCPEALELQGCVKSTSPCPQGRPLKDGVVRYDIELHPNIPFKDFGSGYEGIILGVAMGYSPIVLLGFDHKRNGHYEGYEPYPNVKVWPCLYIEKSMALHERINAVARNRGQRIVNCTPDSALTMYEAGELERVL